MPSRLVALDGGTDIPLDRSMMVVGRHPLCDVRLDSPRISRHHCCMTRDEADLIVRDLGSTNGIRVNGERVERGRLRPGDELSIAHIRYRLEPGAGQESTIADATSMSPRSPLPPPGYRPGDGGGAGELLDRPLVQVVRDALGVVPEHCRIQVIVQMDKDPDRGGATPDHP